MRNGRNTIKREKKNKETEWKRQGKEEICTWKESKKRTKEQNGYVDREYQLRVEETNFGNRSSLSCQYEKDKFCWIKKELEI